jgi:two-component system phosphate regulon sensor histidine kinase PhoR
MKNNLKIKFLLGSCVLIIGTLSFIQFYLVQNTYKLTKEKYYAEIRRDINKITELPVNAQIEEKAQENLKYMARLFVDKQIDRSGFIKSLAKRNDSVLHTAALKLGEQIKSNTSTKNIRYRSQYDEIVLTYEGRTDTLLSGADRPFELLGKSFETPNSLLISNGNNIFIDGPDSGSRSMQSHPIKLQIRRSEYLDVSSWEQEVFKRMAGIYLLAILLIVAVIVLFYFVFGAMIRQKKLAGIKTDFANNITHELKTPLTSVGLILKSLDMAEIQQDKQKTAELLATLRRQYEKIQQTVDFVLESAMEAHPEIHKQETDIVGYLHSYIGDLRIANHILRSDILPATKAVITNTQLLDKILNNLVENAVKYSPEGSVITLKGYPSGPHYFIEIVDQGPGIASAYQVNLFDKFFRIPEENKHTVKGLGLGLYLSRQAAIAIGGNLSLKSTSGAGCVFTLELPL